MGGEWCDPQDVFDGRLALVSEQRLPVVVSDGNGKVPLDALGGN
jgi:hypothetical protein